MYRRRIWYWISTIRFNLKIDEFINDFDFNRQKIINISSFHFRWTGDFVLIWRWLSINQTKIRKNQIFFFHFYLNSQNLHVISDIFRHFFVFFLISSVLITAQCSFFVWFPFIFSGFVSIFRSLGPFYLVASSFSIVILCILLNYVKDWRKYPNNCSTLLIVSLDFIIILP